MCMWFSQMCIWLSGAVLLCSGCAKLTIGVDVYTGELVLTDKSKLAQAVGVAELAYQYATSVKIRKKYCGNDSKVQNANRLLNGIKDSYEAGRINKRWQEYLALPPAHKDRKRIHDNLASELMKFAGECRVSGQAIGLSSVLSKIPLGLVFGVLSAVNDPVVEAGITMEESGREILSLVDALYGGRSGQISSIMRSITEGVQVDLLASTVRRDLFTLIPNVKDMLEPLAEGQYWSKINTITVEGMGDTKFVVIKDSLGNWHIKDVQANQSKIANAIFAVSTKLVGVLAAAYGVPVGSTESGSKNEAPNQIAQGEVNAAKAAQIKRQIGAAKNGFRVALMSAINQEDAVVMQKLLKDAVTDYQTRLNAIKLGSQDQDSNTDADTSDMPQSP